MIRREHYRIIGLAVTAAALFWLADAFMDTALRPQEPFLTILFSDRKEISFRVLFSACFLLFGVYMARAFSKQKRIEEALRKEIAERHHAEDSLREMNAKLRTLIQAIPDLVVFKDPRCRYVVVNEKVEEFTGRAQEELAGKTNEELLPPELAAACTRSDEEALSTRGSVHVEEKNTDGNGHTTYFDTVKAPVYDDLGNLAGLVAVSRDITLRKEAELKLKLFSEAVDSAADGVQITDLNGYITYSNRAVEHITGYSRQELQGVHVEEMVADPEFIGNVVIPSIKKMGQWDGELMAKHMEGRVFPIWLTTSLVRDDEGLPIAIVGLVRDITERKRAEQALAQKTAELERSNKDLEHFASIVSHDLKEPLTSIGGFAEVLNERYRDKLDAKARGALNHIIQGAVRMELLISDILAYARAAAGVRSSKPVHCSTVLGVVLSNLRAAIEKHDAVITFDTLPVVQGDEVQFVQLFQNLIGNAIKFRSGRPPEVHVSARPIDARAFESDVREPDQRLASGWIFSVSDNGIGLDPVHSERIFQIFQRLHPQNDDYPGTGIGLAICKRIVERHGGRIWVESEPGQGSTFLFSMFDQQPEPHDRARTPLGKAADPCPR